MARIRTIKPEFWTDGAVLRLPYEARLFYIGIWNFACDRGHVEDDPFGLKLKILPADPVDGDELVQRLVDAGRIERISVEGRPFLSVPRFADHQRVDTRWKARCPVCAHLDSGGPTETHASSDETRGIETKPHVGGEGRGRERKGGEGTSQDADPPTPKCKKHPHWDHSESCGTCGRDRRAFEAWEAAEAKKPKPVKPHVHRWLKDGTCMTCEAVRGDG